MATTIAAALTDLLFTPDLELGTAIDRHFTPDSRQRTDGRFQRIQETTLLLEGAESDQTLGSAR